MSDKVWISVSSTYTFMGSGLGLLSLILNRVTAPTPNDRRKIQVMMWGAAASILPMMITCAIAVVQHKLYCSYPFWFFVKLFIGVNDDDMRRLRYVNCGPPLIVREEQVERLCATATVFGAVRGMAMQCRGEELHPTIFSRSLCRRARSR